MNTWRILHGDVRERLRDLPDGSVQTCVTSPPYWGLRDYGVQGQIGLEQMPEQFVSALVEVFREVRRVLKDDGTAWVNLGDSYAGSNASQGGDGTSGGLNRDGRSEATRVAGQIKLQNRLTAQQTQVKMGPGMKPKDLCGIPWRVAFALQADGWYLRSDIIWSKPNPMPESVTDRPTKAHEYIFLLSKSARYYYDADAISEPIAGYVADRIRREADAGMVANCNVQTGSLGHNHAGGTVGKQKGARAHLLESGRNKRSVWHIAAQPFSGAHFAVFPEALIEPCILAATSEKGQCPACGKAWVRQTEREPMEVRPTQRRAAWQAADDKARTQVGGTMTKAPTSTTVGWQPSCDCHAGAPVPQTVLDPFNGSGTTGAVAIRHQRNYVGIELNADYITLARKRIRAVAPLFSSEVA